MSLSKNKIEQSKIGFSVTFNADNLKEIDNEAFLNCENLKKLLIPSTCSYGIEFAKANGIPYEEI